jgi:hypothetical protein
MTNPKTPNTHIGRIVEGFGADPAFVGLRPMEPLRVSTKGFNRGERKARR